MEAAGLASQKKHSQKNTTSDCKAKLPSLLQVSHKIVRDMRSQGRSVVLGIDFESQRFRVVTDSQFQDVKDFRGGWQLWVAT